jgi:Sortase domain
VVTEAPGRAVLPGYRAAAGSGAPTVPTATVENPLGPRPSPAHRAVPEVAGGRRVGLAVAVGMALVGAVIVIGDSGVRAAAGSDPAAAPSPAAPSAPAPVPAPAALPTPPATVEAVALRATEVRLPTLDVRSELVGLDVGSDGALQPPDSPDVAGWFVRGAVPGEPGPTVVAGHVDSWVGPGVFSRLDQLAPGDRVEVTRSDGQVFGYRVVTVERHPKNAFPTARVYGPTPGPELRLITCGGDFDRRHRRYLDNIVVTAVPAP